MSPSSLVAVIIFVNIFALASALYSYDTGNCDALSLKFITGLILKKVKEILDPSLINRNKNVRFDLYTRLNPYRRQKIVTGNRTQLQNSNFNSKWPVRFSIHGWNGTPNTCSNAAIKDAYIQRGDYNVFIVDWSDYSLNVIYPQVVTEMFEIAQMIVDFARFINQERNVRFEDMYLIGHSAGCHIAGIAGKLLRPNLFGVIYSLDASGPIHRVLSKEWRLVSSDALYVESIQTDLQGFGFPSSEMGHASIYPNWAQVQPHCPNGTAMEPNFTCNHFGSLYYFVESLANSTAFGAVRCKNFDSILRHECGCKSKICPADGFMGGDPAVPKKGVFYLSTHGKHPFGYGNMCRIRK